MMESIGVLSARNTAFVLEQARLFAKDRGLGAPDDMQIERRPIYFVNESGHEIPPYAVMQVEDYFDNGVTTHHVVKRPFDYTACQTHLLFNGPYAVPDGERGTAQNGPIYQVVHNNAITYSIGDRMGPTANSFEVGLGSILVHLGRDDVTLRGVRVAFDYSAMSGNAAVEIPAGGSGTFRRRRKTSTGFDDLTGDSFKVYTCWNDSSTPIASGRRIIAWPCEGVWLATEVC
jgi:hypothetical protein